MEEDCVLPLDGEGGKGVNNRLAVLLEVAVSHGGRSQNLAPKVRGRWSIVSSMLWQKGQLWLATHPSWNMKDLVMVFSCLRIQKKTWTFFGAKLSQLSCWRGKVHPELWRMRYNEPTLNSIATPRVTTLWSSEPVSNWGRNLFLKNIQFFPCSRGESWWEGGEVCRTIALQPLSEMSESSGNKLPARLDRGVRYLSSYQTKRRLKGRCQAVPPSGIDIGNFLFIQHLFLSSLAVPQKHQSITPKWRWTYFCKRKIPISEPKDPISW